MQTVQLCNCAHGTNATVQQIRNHTSSQVMTVRLQMQLGVVHGYTTHVQLCKLCKLCNSARALPSPIILLCTVCLGSRAEAVLCIRVKDSEPGGQSSAHVCAVYYHLCWAYNSSLCCFCCEHCKLHAPIGYKRWHLLRNRPCSLCLTRRRLLHKHLWQLFRCLHKFRSRSSPATPTPGHHLCCAAAVQSVCHRSR